MANFELVLLKTIALLESNSPAMRERVFDKARLAIEAKLASIHPPPPEIVADRQRHALEDAISSVQAHFAEGDRTGSSLPENWPSMSISKPPEPGSGEGPTFALNGNKLTAVPHVPSPQQADAQSVLHHRVKRFHAALTPLLERSANRYPELNAAVQEYGALLEARTSEIDVVGLWAVGGSLYSFGDAYRRQNVENTVSEPLEPAIESALQDLSRGHGAFILGFDEGRDLVQKADEFLVDRERIAEIQSSGQELLELFSSDSIVDPSTRRQHKPVIDYVSEFGWQSSRVGYSAYLIVRNGIYSLVRLSVGNDANAGNVAGFLVAGSVIAGDPNAEFLRTAIPALQVHGAQMLAFLNHSPEFRSYLEWALSILSEDDRLGSARHFGHK